MFLSAVLRDEQTGQIVGVLPVAPRTFKSGSDGFFGCDKVRLGEERTRYQVTVTVVRIKSAPSGAPDGQEVNDASIESK